VKKTAPSKAVEMPELPELPASQKPVSAVELARILGISHATVSFVTNGLAQKNKISKKTTQRVLEAAKKYNYIPNQMARNLKSRRSGMVGVMLGNFKMDWAEAAMAGMHRVFDATELTPFVATHGFDPARNRKELMSSLQRRDEGIIAFPMPDCEQLYRNIVSSGVPLVFLGDQMPGLEEINSVAWNSEKAAEAAVRHLVQLGRKRIAFLTIDYPGIGCLHRFKAYCRVLRENGLEVRDSWIARPAPLNTLKHIINSAFDQLFADPNHMPDAIYAVNDGLALPALDELEARGFAVPRDIALIGMGDLPPCGYRGVGLSTMREPVEELGAVSAQLLLDLISGKIQSPVHRAIESCELIPRRTTIGHATPG